MPKHQRKGWTEDEDKILLKVFIEQKINKWSEIAKIMEEDYGIENRNGKQCRERYHNHLDKSIKKIKWTNEQENTLIEMHNELGNRWAIIAKAIPGRTDNCVKNQLYSILRRGIKIINSQIKRLKKSINCEPLKVDFIYDLVEAAESNFNDDKGRHSMKIIKESLRIKKLIISLGIRQKWNTEEEDEVQASSQELDYPKIIKEIESLTQKIKAKAQVAKKAKKEREKEESDELSEEELLDKVPSDPEIKYEFKVVKFPSLEQNKLNPFQNIDVLGLPKNLSSKIFEPAVINSKSSGSKQPSLYDSLRSRTSDNFFRSSDLYELDRNSTPIQVLSPFFDELRAYQQSKWKLTEPFFLSSQKEEKQ